MVIDVFSGRLGEVKYRQLGSRELGFLTRIELHRIGGEYRARFQGQELGLDASVSKASQYELTIVLESFRPCLRPSVGRYTKRKRVHSLAWSAPPEHRFRLLNSQSS